MFFSKYFRKKKNKKNFYPKRKYGARTVTSTGYTKAGKKFKYKQSLWR